MDMNTIITIGREFGSGGKEIGEIVTITFALLEMLTFLTLLFSFSFSLMALTFLILVLLVSYIRHYCVLENRVQKMYR